MSRQLAERIAKLQSMLDDIEEVQVVHTPAWATRSDAPVYAPDASHGVLPDGSGVWLRGGSEIQRRELLEALQRGTPSSYDKSDEPLVR